MLTNKHVAAPIWARSILHQAGGFALEDPDLRPLVDKIEGSVDSIFGLPVDLLCALVERAAA